MSLYEERAKLVAENRALLERVEAAGRPMSGEELAEYDARDKRVEELGETLDRRATLDKRESDLATLEPRRAESTPTATASASPTLRIAAAPDPAEFTYDLPLAKAFSGMVAAESQRSLPLGGPTATTEYRKQFAHFIRSGDRLAALQAGSDTLGGYTVAPQQFLAQLIKFVDNAVFIRQLATVIQLTGAASLGVPTLDTDMGDADWTSELLTGSEDSSMAFGKRELRPVPLARRIKLSNRLLASSALNVEALAAQRMAYKFGVVEESAYLTGTGANQPLGVFTASSNGISTARDVSTDNTTTAMTADGLINAFYSLKAPYQASSVWVFHRDGVKQLRKLKDGEGQYLWQPGLQGGQPSLILGRPYVQSEYAPNTFTTGQYVGIVGDFSYYWIAVSLSMTVQRLVELYAETNQIGLVGRMELDGMPVLEEAFARVKLA